MHALFFACLLGSSSLPPAAAQAHPAPADTIAARVRVLGVDCALFPAAARWSPWISPAAPTRHFAPTVAQAQATEQALAAVSLLRINPGPHNEKEQAYARVITQRQRLKEYHRQYFGFYNAQRQPCLFISSLAALAYEPADLLPQPPPGYVPHWLRAYQSLSDSRDNFWSVYYNLATQRFYNYEHDLGVGGE